MSSPSQSPNALIDLKRAEQLKQELTEFATSGPLREEYERQRQLFLEFAAPSDEHEAESVLDWFIFEWLDDYGQSAIDYFLSEREDLSEEDQETLLDWEDSINSAFEIRSLAKNSLRLKDLESDDTFDVVTIASLDGSPFKRGQYIVTRLLPLGDKYIFSGLQFVMPDQESAEMWLEMRRAFDEMDSPEAIEQAQREQCRAFCDLFGRDEMTVSSNELKPTLQKFQNYLLTERRDPETGMTAAEVFRQEFGRELQVPEMPPLPAPLADAVEVTILCDDFDGIVLLPDYTKFRSIFESSNPDKDVPDWRDLVWKYIKDPDIPIVAFERIAEQFPQRVEEVLRKTLDDKNFSLDHLYAVLLHYKEPVEGVDLETDEMLWDLFEGNGNNSPNKPAKPKSATSGKAKTSAAKKQSAATKASAKNAATKKSSAKKTGAKKSAAKKTPALKAGRKTRAAASTKSKPAAKAKAGSKRRASRKSSAKKR